jgi:hypothetical protein
VLSIPLSFTGNACCTLGCANIKALLSYSLPHKIIFKNKIKSTIIESCTFLIAILSIIAGDSMRTLEFGES